MKKSFDNTNDEIVQRSAMIFKSAQFWLSIFVFSDNIVGELNE